MSRAIGSPNRRIPMNEAPWPIRSGRSPAAPPSDERPARHGTIVLIYGAQLRGLAR
jgi:hypothetical protein